MTTTRILVVEDESIVAKDIQNKLNALGYSVPAVVSSGEEAIEKATERDLDLVLMDIKLAGDIDGVEAAEQIYNRFNIPVIYLTAYAGEETLKRAKLTEPYAYIIKPFNERELKSNIEIALYKHKSESEIRKTKDYLENILNSASELIITLDTNGKITAWNKSTEIATGYKKREVIGKHITTLSLFANSRELLDNIKKISLGMKTRVDNIIVNTKIGTKRLIQVSSSIIKTTDKQNSGILLIGKDVTKDKELHRNLLNGNSYLITDKNNKSALSLLASISNSNYKGLYLTRANPEILKTMFSSKDIQISLLNQDKLDIFENIADLNELKNKIAESSKKNKNLVILLDRIDYLITMFSFEKFINTLYKINNIIIKNKAILLVYLNPPDLFCFGWMRLSPFYNPRDNPCGKV